MPAMHEGEDLANEANVNQNSKQPFPTHTMRLVQKPHFFISHTSCECHVRCDSMRKLRSIYRCG